MILSDLRQWAGGADEGRLLAQLADEVRLVEEELERQVASPARLVDEVSRHTLGAGGKRLRPAFVALAAQAAGGVAEPGRARVLGACMEMIHMATLIHDDVIDHATLRRGRQTAAALYGNTAAVLGGDALLARAMAILARDGDLRIIRTVADAVVEMAEGEVRELELRGRLEVSEAEHLEVLRMKTAAFIQCCCEVGALVAGAERPVHDALSAYGHHVGMAFQIVDDLLDYRGVQTGKARASDFREGCATLPLILLQPALRPDEREMVCRKFGNGVTDEEINRIVSWMAERGAFDLAEERARRHVDEACAALEPMPGGPAKELLRAAASLVMRRDR